MIPLSPEAESRIAQLDEEILALRRRRDELLISHAALVEQLADAHRENSELVEALRACRELLTRPDQNAEARRAFLGGVR